MLRRSVGWCEGQLTVLLQPATVEMRDIQALWSAEDARCTAEERAARQAERLRLQARIHARLFNDVYSYMLRIFALLMNTSTLKMLQPPACQPLTRVWLHDVFVHKLVEYQMQFLPHSHRRRIFLFFCAYGGENRTALIDADKSVELIRLTRVPEAAYRGTIIEVLASSTDAVAPADTDVWRCRRRRHKIDRAGDADKDDSKNGMGNEDDGKSGTGNEDDDRKSGVGGENGGSGRVTDGKDDGDGCYRLRFPTHVSSRAPRRVHADRDAKAGGASVPTLSCTHAVDAPRTLWMRDTLTWAGRSVRDQTLVERQAYLDPLVHDLDEPPSAKDANNVPGMCDTPIVLKKVSTFTLGDAASVLLDRVPFFQTHLPRLVTTATAAATTTRATVPRTIPASDPTRSSPSSSVSSSSSAAPPLSAEPNNKHDERDEDGDVTLECETQTAPTFGTPKGADAALATADTSAQKAVNRREQKVEVTDVRYESYAESRSLWMVPVASSYLVNDAVSPQQRGMIVEPSPIYEIVDEVTVPCRTRFRGRLIVCETLELAPGRSARSSICTLAYVPTDPVHAHLSHAHDQHARLCEDYRRRQIQRHGLWRGNSNGSTSSGARGRDGDAADDTDGDEDEDEPPPYVCAYLALEPSKRWRLHAILPLRAHISPAERLSSTATEIDRRLKWIGRREYCDFLRAIR